MMNPTQLGEMLVENARAKHGDVVAHPTNMIPSEPFTRFCEGRNFTAADRDECVVAYKNRWEILKGDK